MIGKRNIITSTVIVLIGILIGGLIIFNDSSVKVEQSKYGEWTKRDVAAPNLRNQGFKELSWEFFTDGSTVLYWEFNTKLHEPTEVEGIDAKTAIAADQRADQRKNGVEYINSAEPRRHIILDGKWVYIQTTAKTERFIENENFRFLDWEIEGKSFATTYGISGDNVVCFYRLEGRDNIFSKVLKTDSASFKPILVSGQNFYAKDEIGNYFVNCSKFPKVNNESMYDLSIEPFFGNNGVGQLLFLSDNAIYNKDGVILLETEIKDKDSFHYDEFGFHFELDGEEYYYGRASTYWGATGGYEFGLVEDDSLNE